MASVAMLSPALKKEPDVLPRTSLLPKRKPVVSNIATRARFVKPRPNVAVNKAPKEPLPPPSESTKVDDNVPTPPVETKSETLQRPALPKRAPAIPASSRARFQRAKPNIGSLMNKPAKEVQSSEDKSVPASDENKLQEPANPKVDLSDASKTESPEEEKSNDVCDSSSVIRSPKKTLQNDSNCSNAGPEETKLLNTEKVADMAYSVTESQYSSQPAIDIDSICGNSQEFFNMRTVPDDTPLESHSDKSSNAEPTTEISFSCLMNETLMSPRAAFLVSPEKEGSAVYAMNKGTEYPTLKSILNSPRKRTATKKVHERRKRVANFSSTPSRSEMTMVDLIYWNPSSSPMKEVKPAAPAVEDLLPADDPPPAPEETTEDCSIGPKVIINDDGEIILDESSLFVRRKDTVDHSIAAVIENDNTTYSSFRNRSFKTWTNRETAKFYKALSLVGTDFALMENIFREDGKVTRTRRELKLKFKREEKSNPKLVHTAMYELQTYDLNILDDEQDIMLLEESELIDDAPKQAKKSAAQGTRAPGKRGRRKKSELTGVTSNENTMESIPGTGEESRDIAELLFNVDFQGNKNNDSESNSRPGRARKAKDLSDYITDVDELSDSDNFYNVGDTLLMKKRKRAQVLSEEEDATIVTTAGNDLTVDGHSNVQEKTANIEEISPCVAEERAGVVNEKDPATMPIKKRRKLDVLPIINEENIETINPLSDLMPETSRSGRIIKAKNMSDFITDPDAMNDLEDDMTPGENMQNLEEINIISHEENAENLNVVESVSQLCSSTHPEGEFSIIPPAESDGENPTEQNIICTLDVENPNENISVLESFAVTDQNELNNPDVVSTTEIVTPSTEASSAIIPVDEPKGDSLAELPISEVCNDADANAIITDPLVTEVVITSDQTPPRRLRRRIMPNVIKGSKRPPLPKKPLPPPRRASFTSFTPVEEVPQVLPKINCVQSTKTYSKHNHPKQTSLKQIKSEKLDDIPEYLETVQTSPVNVRKRSLSGPAKSPSTPEMNISRTNPMFSPTRPPLTNTPLNVLSFKSDSTSMTQPPTELPIHALTADPKTINMNPENCAESPPVVILTRTPNNSNMLHLFLYQKS